VADALAHQPATTIPNSAVVEAPLPPPPVVPVALPAPTPTPPSVASNVAAQFRTSDTPNVARGPFTEERTMLVVFANNMTLAGYNAVATTIFTDPVAIGDNNRASGITSVAKIFLNGSNGLKWWMQTSNDGIAWVDQGPAQSSALTTETDQMQNPTEVSGVYARLKFEFKSDASVVGAVVFSVKVNLNRV
jgi:hypothetical protein